MEENAEKCTVKTDKAVVWTSPEWRDRAYGVTTVNATLKAKKSSLPVGTEAGHTDQPECFIRITIQSSNYM